MNQRLQAKTEDLISELLKCNGKQRIKTANYICEVVGAGLKVVKDAAKQVKVTQEQLEEGAFQPSLPQDVEEWIAENEFRDSWGVNAIYTSDLRAFLAGKVLVEIGVIERALTAIRNELESAYQQGFPVCCGRSGQECCGSPDPDWPEEAKATMENLGSVERELAAILTTSKENE